MAQSRNSVLLGDARSVFWWQKTELGSVQEGARQPIKIVNNIYELSDLTNQV